jgi:hypothetical protein
MMVDLASFGEEKFNAKGWVNAACKARHPDDSMEKYLGDLEMKLQLMAESIAGSLEEQSAQALLRVPRASRDVLRIRDDAISLRSTVSAVLNKLNQVPLSLSLSLSLLWYLSSFFLICVIRPLLLFIFCCWFSFAPALRCRMFSFVPKQRRYSDGIKSFHFWHTASWSGVAGF